MIVTSYDLQIALHRRGPGKDLVVRGVDEFVPLEEILGRMSPDFSNAMKLAEINLSLNLSWWL